MGAVVRISEEDAAQDFTARLARVRLADLVVVVCNDVTEAPIRLRKPAIAFEGRTIAQARELLRKCSELRGLASGSPELATDPRYQLPY